VNLINDTNNLNLKDGPFILTPANKGRIMEILPSNGPFSIGNVGVRFPAFSITGLWGAPELTYNNVESPYYGKGYYFGGYLRYPYWDRYPWANFIELAQNNGDPLSKERITKVREIVKNWVQRPWYYNQNNNWSWRWHWNWGSYMNQLSKTAYTSERSPINGIEPWLLPYLIPGQFDVTSSDWRSAIVGRTHWSNSDWFYWRSSTLFTILYSNGDLFALKAKWSGKKKQDYICDITPHPGYGYDGIMPHFYGWGGLGAGVSHPYNQAGAWGPAQGPTNPGAKWFLEEAENENIRPGSLDSRFNWPADKPAMPGGCYGHAPCYDRRRKGFTRNSLSNDCDNTLTAVWVEHYNVYDRGGNTSPVTGYGISTQLNGINFPNNHRFTHMYGGKNYINGMGGAAHALTRDGMLAGSPSEGSLEVDMGYAVSVSISENELVTEHRRPNWTRWEWMAGYWDWWYGYYWTPFYWGNTHWHWGGYPWYNWHTWRYAYWSGYWWYGWYLWGAYGSFNGSQFNSPGGFFDTGRNRTTYRGWWWWRYEEPRWGIKSSHSSAYNNKLMAKAGSQFTTHQRVDFAVHWNTGLLTTAASGDSWYGHEDFAASGLCAQTSGVLCEPYSGVQVDAVGGLLWYSMQHYKNAWTGSKDVNTAGESLWQWTPHEASETRPLLTTFDCGLGNTFYFPTGIDGTNFWHAGWYFPNRLGACLTGHEYLFPQVGGQHNYEFYHPRPNIGQTNDNYFIAIKDGWDSFFHARSSYAGAWWNLMNSIPNGGIGITGNTIVTVGNAMANQRFDGTYSYLSRAFTGFSHTWERLQDWHESYVRNGYSWPWSNDTTAWPNTQSPRPHNGTNQTYYQLAIPGPSGQNPPPVYDAGFGNPSWPYGVGSGLAYKFAYDPHPDHLQPVTTSGFNDFLIDFITGVCTGSQHPSPHIPSSEGCRWKHGFTGNCPDCEVDTKRAYLVVDYKFPNLIGTGTAKVYVRDWWWPAQERLPGFVKPARNLICEFHGSVQKRGGAYGIPSPASSAPYDPTILARKDYCYVYESGIRQAWIPMIDSGARVMPPHTGRYCHDEYPDFRGWDQCSQYGFYVGWNKILNQSTLGYGYWGMSYYVPQISELVLRTPMFDDRLGGKTATFAGIIPRKIYKVEVDLEWKATVPANESWNSNPNHGEPGWQPSVGNNYSPPSRGFNMNIGGPVDCNEGGGNIGANTNVACIDEKTVDIKETYEYNDYLRGYAADACVGMYPHGGDQNGWTYSSQFVPGIGHTVYHHHHGYDKANGYADIGGAFWNLGEKYPTGFYEDLWRHQGYWKIQSPDALTTVNNWTACHGDGFWKGWPTSMKPAFTPHGPNSTIWHPCRAAWWQLSQPWGANYPWSCSAFGVTTWRHETNHTLLAPPWPICGAGKAGANYAKAKLEMYKMTAQAGGGFAQGNKVFEKKFRVGQPSWSNHQAVMDFYIPGKNCLCVGTGNRGFLNPSTHCAGYDWWNPNTTSSILGCHEMYEGERYLPAAAVIEDAFQHYKFKWTFDLHHRTTKWARYPFLIQNDIYNPVGVLKYENEWTGQAPANQNCTYVAWNTRNCGNGISGPHFWYYGANGMCNCDCRGKGFFNSYDPQVIGSVNMPTYDFYIQNIWKFWAPWNMTMHSPLYKGLEFKITKGTNTYNITV